MKTFSLVRGLAITLAALPCMSEAVVYTTDFSGYALGEMVGQDGWTANDLTTADVGSIINAGGVWGSRTGTTGFVAPVTRPDLYVSRNVADVSLLTGSTSFSVLYQVIDSDSGYGAGAEIRDTFGFRLENAAGDNLFSFFLNPFDQDAVPENDTAFHTFSWSTGNNAPTVALNGLASQELFAYTFTISFFDAGGTNVGFNASINGDSFSGTLNGLASESIGRIGATWNLTDTTEVNGEYFGGSNFLLFDNVTLVPEPSTTLLVGLAGIGLALRRKRD